MRVIGSREQQTLGAAPPSSLQAESESVELKGPNNWGGIPLSAGSGAAAYQQEVGTKTT